MNKPLVMSFDDFVKNAITFYHVKKKISYQQIIESLRNRVVELEEYLKRTESGKYYE